MAPTLSTLDKEAMADPTRFLTTITEEDESAVCVFCKSSKLDDVNWGVMYEKDGIITHYFCMLLSAALKQNGKDEEGILGFLPVDIMKEVKRCQRLKCVYCGELGASVGCCNKRCKIMFHLPCGIENGTNSQFHSNFESYCPNHAKHKQVSLSSLASESCPICMCEIEADERIVKGTCCKAAVFHKECIQRMATSAGYMFKCPTCNKTKSFIHEMKSSGIFVPDQDASWEKDNGFQDLYIQYSHCDATECKCTEGREYGDEKGNWSLARCRLCGAAGVHKHCGKVTNIDNWACDPCLEVEMKAESMNKTATLNHLPPKAQTSNDLPAPSTSRGTITLNRNATPTNRQRNAPKTPILMQDDDCHEDVKLENCTIHSSCFSYFPYTKSKLKTFKKSTTLPDWREMELTVNLVSWVPGLESNPEMSVPSPSTGTAYASRVHVPSTSAAPTRRRPRKRPRATRRRKKKTGKSIQEMEAEEVMEDTLRLEQLEAFPAPKYSRPATSGGRRKRSLWSAGVHNAVAVKRRMMRRKQLACHKVTTEEEDPASPPPIVEEEDEEVTEAPFDCSPLVDVDDAESEPRIEEVEEPGIELVDLSQASEDDEPKMDAAAGPSLLSSTGPEPTPEQMSSFKALGDRLRTELSQNRNELSLSRTRPGFFSTEGYREIHRRKQWFSPERMKERQAMMGDPEL